MKLDELLPVLHSLPRADKFSLVQILGRDLAEETGETLQADADYPVWSPFEAGDAAATLTRFLQEQPGGV